MTFSKLSKGLGHTKARTKVFQDNDSEKQHEATTRQGTVRMLRCYKEILKE